jgi:hypothetical protein
MRKELFNILEFMNRRIQKQLADEKWTTNGVRLRVLWYKNKTVINLQILFLI